MLLFLSGPPSSQLQQFQDFLLRANKYSCLQMSGDASAAHRKVILVEVTLHTRVTHVRHLRFVRTSRCPLVFIVSDSVSADSSSRNLFPEKGEFLWWVCVSHVFTLMYLCVCVCEQSGGHLSAPDHPLLERLCSGSSGDIRSAINSLQFSCVPGQCHTGQCHTGQYQVSATRVSGKRKAVAEEEEQAIGGKDASLFLFRALGKILHCKQAAEDQPRLPAHLSEHQREPLLVDPESVVERSHMSSDLFNLYLHQNYLDFFCEAEDVARASQYLSDADLLSADWTTRSLMCEYSSSVATRGLLHSNSRQVTVGFRPLHKPHWLHVHKKVLPHTSLFRNYCLTPVGLQTELLPYLAKLCTPMRNQAQIDLIQDVGQLSLRRRPDRY
uniref:RAD17 checkpoint clamp loader component n=1 Tax=Neogobius melanostomus TaxID=47308 RepID=A0A8C6T4J3_9GOBI